MGKAFVQALGRGIGSTIVFKKSRNQVVGQQCLQRLKNITDFIIRSSRFHFKEDDVGILWKFDNTIFDTGFSSVMDVAVKQAIDNRQFAKVLMDFAAILFTQASSLSSTMINAGELLSILKELRHPIKQAFNYTKSRVSEDIELHDMFQRLLTAMRVLDEEVIQKVVGKTSSDLHSLDSSMVPLVKTLEHEVGSLALFLKRIGFDTSNSSATTNSCCSVQSAWSLARPTSEHHRSGTLWPLLFLPNRNIYYLPRDALMIKTLSLMQPLKKPTHLCVVNKGGYGGLGRSQLVLEASYKSIEKGTFGVVFWLSCISESSLVSSYRNIARKIGKIDPNFSDLLASVNGEHNFHNCTQDFVSSNASKPDFICSLSNHDLMISLVVNWLSKVPIPYLLVFDGADDPSFFSSRMFPQIGQGSIVLVTGFSHLSRWTALLETRPKAVELTTLSYEEGLYMSETGLDTISHDQSDKEAIIELLNYYHKSPAGFCNAILTINCMRNCSFINIGPKEYLSRIRSSTCGPAGLISSHGNSDNVTASLSHSSSNDMLQRIDTSYRSFLMRLYTAQNFDNACESSQKRLLDLMAFISCDGVSTTLLHHWLTPKNIFSPMKISVSLNRPTGIRGVSCGKYSENDSTELIVEVCSYLPRMLQSTGDFFFEWKVLRSFADLKIFLDTLYPHCSSRLPKGLLFDLKESEEFVLHRAVKGLNKAFAALCDDLLWPSLCDQSIVKKFLNIHTNDLCHSSPNGKICRILDPLIAVGLVHVVRRSQNLLRSGEGTEVEEKGGDDHVSCGSEDELMVGIDTSVQDSLKYMLEQEGRARLVSGQVLEFLSHSYKAAIVWEDKNNTQQRHEDKGSVDIMNRNIARSTDNEWISRDCLLPHIMKAITVPSAKIEMCIELCELAFSFSKGEELFHTAEFFCRRTLQFLKETNGTQDSTFWHVSGRDIVVQRKLECEAVAIWQHKLALCSSMQDRYSDGVLHYAQALKARLVVSSAPESDIYIAKIEEEFAHSFQCLGTYDKALSHYEEALKTYMMLLKSQSVSDTNCFDIRSHIALIHERLATMNCYESKYSLALHHITKALDTRRSECCTSPQTPSDFASEAVRSMRERILHCLLIKSRVLMASGDWEAAKETLVSTLQECHLIYSCRVLQDESINHEFCFTFSQLRNKVTVLCNLSECNKRQADYCAAKDCLKEAELLFVAYEAYYDDCDDNNKLSEFWQNKRATSKLRIAVHESAIEVFVELSELESAVFHAEKAQEACLCLYGANHHRTSLMICKMGNLLKSLGRFNEATQLFKRVLSITDQNLRLDGAVAALNSLADMAATQADFFSAENFLQDALKILQYKFKDGGSSLIADQFILLAELKKEQNLFECAKDFYESALCIQRKCCGNVHLSVAHTLDYLTDLFTERGEQRGSQVYREESAKIYEELRQQQEVQENESFQSDSRGDSSPIKRGSSRPIHNHTSANMSSSALHSMASLLSSVSKGISVADPESEDTEPLHSRALRILTSQYGKNHPRVAMALNNLAKVLSKKGKRFEAQLMLETALSILRKVHGENHPHVAAALHNLGILFGEQGQLHKAITHVLAALNIRELVASGNTLLISESLRSLGYFYYQVNYLPQSRDALERCVALRRQLFEGVQNLFPVAVSLNNLGVVLRSMMMHDEAEKCFRESLLMRLTAYGDPSVDICEECENKDRNYHPAIAHAWHTLGVLLVSMAKYHEARMYLEHSLNARRLLCGDVHADVATTLHSLAELCMCERRIGDAAMLFREAVDIRVSLYGEDSPLVLATMRVLWLISIDSEPQQHFPVQEDREEQSIQRTSIPTHKGKILFGSEQESEVFLRIKAKLLRMDSNPSASTEDVAAYGADVIEPSLREGSKVNITQTPLDDANAPEDASSHSSLLDLVMNALEEDQEGNTAAQFLKFEAIRKAQLELNRLTQSQKLSQYSNIEGGDGWPERLLQKMIHDKNSLTSELREQEADMIEKRNTYGQHESVVVKMRTDLSALQASLRALEVRALTDKRVKYELDEHAKDVKKHLVLLEKEEMNADMATLLSEIKGMEETILMREGKLSELGAELTQLERINSLFLQSKVSVSQVDGELSKIAKQIEAARWNLVNMREDDNSSSNGTCGHEEDTDSSTAHSSVMKDVTEASMKANITDLFHKKVDVEICREMEEVKFQRVFNKLEGLRKKYKIAAKNKQDMVKALAAAGQQTTVDSKDRELNIISSSNTCSDDDSSDDDDCEETEENISDEDGLSDKAESHRSAVKLLKKKVKKQKILIDLLRNQIVNLGHKPIAEIVTYQKAESNLQNALARLMDGDETASDDFDKWDEFVRNHPEYKAKQLRLKERFKRENLAVNKAALQMFRTLVPPGIMSTCTLATLEQSLPRGVAKRIWQTKALWLTRIPADRIAILHVADLQSKYSTQGLDELELRAIYASLPQKFDNDAKGEKAAWCEAILLSIQAKCKQLPWSSPDSADTKEGEEEPQEEEVKTYLEGIPRNSTYRNYLTSGPFDPNEAPAEIVEAISSKDEVTSQEEMLKLMSSLRPSGAGVSGGDVKATGDALHTSDVGSGPASTTSSIRRRASMFGASQKRSASFRSESGGEQKNGSSNKVSAHPQIPPKLDFFGELKLKAQKRRATDKYTPAKSEVPTGGGMSGFLGELQRAAKKKQANRAE